MAYLSRIVVPLCDAPLCGARATQRLFNRVNAGQGHYCNRHAERALKAFLEREAER